ncbi:MULTISPECIES: polyribonucleotide nucleotidyltransferase [Caproicibacterium]|jgi:polyribonucleotide nucleotidyltransferase|uniref:Polyribonucleotide nucleotidyltransferase n=1 Tax=Caproicibacterium lactatifermentans TaxID=2666138 RepID=A0A859DXG5_9FIRM|nr:polyribonucleotide nucleotidyltransferase [Caproicibacterium lactatifermentans]ARP51181.1 polyribonucleotide nucleotidyltransferase [Ruminococcaceae bacterium CPB6]MDD4806988.1 polyribonucleotide nucleotidyltransferase [Oscillospiraceae bacterium]QKN24681.1 polyribonucleotide nucleotidyltransferase [Caproicibacterium lactatifermentans]QKO30180.1 polyribonucleotide nucleotidyltransferase [Caproicibacterium lactatifermentans]
MFENSRTYRTSLAGRELQIETGKLAQLANGACMVRYGETAVLCTATASSQPREGVDFFPLSVDYEEKMYAVGRIPGSFLRREGKPPEEAVLAGRLIDRSIRPLFPKDMRNDVTVSCIVMSLDPDCSPVIAALLGASAALSISDIPWGGPVAAVCVGLAPDGTFLINPTEEQRKDSRMAVTVASAGERMVMIEAGAKIVADEEMYQGILTGHRANMELLPLFRTMREEIGKEKFTYTAEHASDEMQDDVAVYALDAVRAAMDTSDKMVRDTRLQKVYADVFAHFAEQYPDSEKQLDESLYKLQKYVVRRWLLDEKKRVDGRGMDEIRPLAAEVDLLPRVHGSGLFTRGQTQVLTTVTLGQVSDAQTLDDLGETKEKRYMHQYNFPSYSVGETKPGRGPNRREIGHGALAERALLPVIPSVDEFPYAMRVVSEVLSSNGSTSQASICGSTLALMAAGVPIQAPVAGISCGLVTEGEHWMTMVDIQGIEDFFGDMDFKVAGTKEGITAIQMDLKIQGLTPAMVREALLKTHKARNEIIDGVLLKAIPAPRGKLSKWAPKMETVQIPVDKIREVIGTGGKVIRQICSECNVQMDVKEDGHVYVSGQEEAGTQRALDIIHTIVEGPKPGRIYCGKVTRLIDFGAFVEIAPGKEGLVHISQLDIKPVNKVTDVVKVGDSVMVKVVEIDSRGRLNLSCREARIELEGLNPADLPAPQPRENAHRRPTKPR